MKHNLKELKEKIEKEIKIDDTEAILLASGNDYSPSGIECPYCSKDIDIKDIIDKVRNRAKLELLNQVEEIIKEWILNLEKHFVLTYLKGTNERIIQFNPSVKVWEKEFKGKLI